MSRAGTARPTRESAEPAIRPEPPAPAHRTRRRPLPEAAVLYGLVALGTSIGGLLRALASLGAAGLLGPGFPWATLFVNAAGSFAIGFYATLTEPGGRVFAGARQRQFVMTGICGGFTTFSVFSLETIRLAAAGRLVAAGLNVSLSVAVWLGAVWLGHLLATRINRLGGL